MRASGGSTELSLGSSIRNLADAPDIVSDTDNNASSRRVRRSTSSGSSSIDRIESLSGSGRQQARSSMLLSQWANNIQIISSPQAAAYALSPPQSLPPDDIPTQQQQQQNSDVEKNERIEQTDPRLKNLHVIVNHKKSTLQYQEDEIEKQSDSTSTDHYENDDDDDYDDNDDGNSSGKYTNIENSFLNDLSDHHCGDTNSLSSDDTENNVNRNIASRFIEKGFPKCSWKLSIWIARYAPCFWCCWKKLQTGATHRSVLLRLNYVLFWMALGQIGSAIFISVSYYAFNTTTTTSDDPHLQMQGDLSTTTPTKHTPTDNTNTPNISEEADGFQPNLWSSHGSILSLGVFGCLISITTVYAYYILRQVNLVGSIRYLWTLMWVLPLEVYSIIFLFDYHGVTPVYIKHYWNSNVLAWSREAYCEAGTAHEECMVPVGGYPKYGINQTTEEAGEIEWCLANYNSTNCSNIRNNAHAEAAKVSYRFFVLNGVWGIMLCVLLVLAIKTSERIISKPIVQKSRQANIPGWLTLPILGSFFSGYGLLFSPSSALSVDLDSEVFWVGLGFMICGGLFFISACLGWLISVYSVTHARDKRTKIVFVRLYIGTLALTTISLATILVACIHYSLRFENFPIEDDERGTIACSIDSKHSCSFCNNRFGWDECPEWSIEDVIKVTQTQMKGSATGAFIFITYSISALQFGFLLQKHVSQYQIDYL